MTKHKSLQLRTKADWDSIEPHYRANIRSLREIGAEFGVSDAAIIKHARKAGWARDLDAKIRAKAEAKVSAAAVSAEVSVANRAKESAVVEANAELICQTRMRHRADIRRSQSLFAVLLGELEVGSSPEGQGLIEALMKATAPAPEDESDEQKKSRERRTRQLLERVLALPDRVDTFKRLIETQDRLIQLERQAFGITDKTPVGENPLDGLKVLSTAERASRLSSLMALAEKRRQDARSSPIPSGPSAPSAASEAKADAA